MVYLRNYSVHIIDKACIPAYQLHAWLTSMAMSGLTCLTWLGRLTLSPGGCQQPLGMVLLTLMHKVLQYLALLPSSTANNGTLTLLPTLCLSLLTRVVSPWLCQQLQFCQWRRPRPLRPSRHPQRPQQVPPRVPCRDRSNSATSRGELDSSSGHQLIPTSTGVWASSRESPGPSATMSTARLYLRASVHAAGVCHIIRPLLGWSPPMGGTSLPTAPGRSGGWKLTMLQTGGSSGGPTRALSRREAL